MGNIERFNHKWQTLRTEISWTGDLKNGECIARNFVGKWKIYFENFKN